MSTWQVTGHGQGPVPLPYGLRIAGLGPRVGAWILDLGFFGLLSVIPLVLASVSGAVGLNPDAMRQETSNPYLQPTVPWLVVNIGPLIAWAAVWVVLAVAYAAACWAFFRGLPGQRLVSLQVADAATGKNLSLPRALWRAILVNGIPAAATAVLFVAVFEVLATTNASDLGSPADTSYLRSIENSSWNGLVSVCDMASWGWPLVLLISTIASRDRRGLHDKVAGSIVVGRGIAPLPWGYQYGPVPGAPQGAIYGPGPGFGPGPGYAPGPGYPYGPPPAAGEPGAAPSTWSEQAPAPRDPEPAPGSPEPAPAKPVGDNPQVFGAMLPEGLRVAGFNRRVAAYGLDSIIVLVLFSVIEMAVVGTQDASVTLPPERPAMLAGFIAGLAQAVLFVATWSIWRGSIGQKAVGLQVGDESTGHRLAVVDSVVRWAVLQGPFALYMAAPYLLRPLVGITAIAWMALLAYSSRSDPDGRGYHDRIAHSMVVEQT